jgi:hypothetical protein
MEPEQPEIPPMEPEQPPIEPEQPEIPPMEPAELQHLKNYIYQHPVLFSAFQTEDLEKIYSWLIETPSPTIVSIFEITSPMDRYSFFKSQHFPTWYSLFNQGITETTCDTSLFSYEQLTQFSTTIISDLLIFKLLEHSIMQIIMEYWTRDGIEQLKTLLYCLQASKVIETKTLLCLATEFIGLPRWQSISLSREPRREDLQALWE